MLQIPSNHSFLKDEDVRFHNYTKSMEAVMSVIVKKSKGNQESLKQALKNKLQLSKRAQPNRDQFLQHACELTVSAYICRLQDCEFSYEYQGKNGKNIDVSALRNDVRFNLEVKCPNPKRAAAPTTAGEMQMRTHGRLQSLSRTVDDLSNLASQLGYSNLASIPNSDHKIKECLIDSASKFRNPPSDSELNCVVICADDGDSLQHYYHCLYGAEGLFTESSFHPPQDYDTVDAVVLTNLRHRHNHACQKQNLSDPWLFERAFSLVLENFLRVKRNAPDLALLASLIPNYCRAVHSFEVPGDVLAEVRDSIKLSYFIDHEMPKHDPECF
jgi:hypothetical protein